MSVEEIQSQINYYRNTQITNYQWLVLNKTFITNSGAIIPALASHVRLINASTLKKIYISIINRYKHKFLPLL